MHAPQFIYCFFLAVGVAKHVALDGQKQLTTYSATSGVFSAAVLLGLLYWGGFFSN